ncbi:MAG: WbqC family protein [Saprospiraceae bacterium]
MRITFAVQMMEMNSCVVGLQYLPSVEYFAHWLHHRTLILEKHEHYQKRTWRNKTAILGPQDALILSIPLQKGKNHDLPISDVKISYDEPWSRIHMHSIQTTYGKTAFFNEIESDIEGIFKNNHQFLWDLNMQFIELFISFLLGEWNMVLTQFYEVSFPASDIDLRKGVPAGLSSLSIESLPVYEQVHRFSNSHLPNLSILDALCHLGPGTFDYLKRYAHELYK